jgi:hypothetical protein
MTEGTPHVDITFALAEAEARAYQKTWQRQQGATAGQGGTFAFAVIAIGIVVGLLAGLIAVALGAVDNSVGGLVTVLAFVAYWCGAWAVSGLAHRANRRPLRQQMDRLRRERWLVIAGDGITVAAGPGTVRWSWSAVRAVTEEAGLILIWLEASPIPIPRRELADPAALLAFIRTHLAGA